MPLQLLYMKNKLGNLEKIKMNMFSYDYKMIYDF